MISDLKIAIILFSILCYFMGCTMLTKESVIDARDDITEKEYESALTILKNEEDDFDDLTETQRGEILLLKAKALYGLERLEETAYVLDILITQYKATSYADQAGILNKKWKLSARINSSN